MNYETEAKQLLDELTAPIPVFVRPMVKKGVEAKMKELMSGEQATIDDVVRAFIMTAPGNMLDKTINLLKNKNIDLTPYEDLIAQKKRLGQ